ncbi:SDR family NAD(P)-dependent oxidoreductase [Methylocystis sp. JAN1]|uniref:SDR family NAD(P)-dependent oxidoreductase n=1 Tax=Methylocystis sp. JAN1 TaxID=3397211 RepID=UPI003FA331D1
MSEVAERRPVCVIAGVGPGNGEAFARRFAAEGYSVALLARRKDRIEPLAAELRGAAFGCDLTDAASVEAAFAAIEAQQGPAAVLIYNAGKGVWGDVEKVTQADFEEAWRVNTLGLFLASRRVIPGMAASARGGIVVVGATASLRGMAGTAAFASAKAAQRSLAQSLARYLWPKGVHVSLIIVDGVVGGPETRKMLSDKPDDFFIKPAAIADIALALTRQERSAWSFEAEARPFGEKW